MIVQRQLYQCQFLQLFLVVFLCSSSSSSNAFLPVAVHSDNNNNNNKCGCRARNVPSSSSSSSSLLRIFQAISDDNDNGMGVTPIRPASSLPPRTSSSSSSSSSPSSPFPSPKKKKKKSKKKKGQTLGTKSDQTRSHVNGISDDDLADHVSLMYIHGPGGVLRERTKKVEQRLQQQALQQAIHIQEHFPSQQDNDNNDNDNDENDIASTAFLSSSTTLSSQSVALNRLNHRPTLVLNADYQPLSYLPLSLWHWQEAVKAVFGGKVTVVDVYPDVTVRAANLEIPLPSVIALNGYVSKTKQLQQYTPAFTKRNVFLRDEYRCQYCLGRFHTRDLSLDHVVPRSHGGPLSWNNVVTCCHACNGRKGSLPLSQLDRVGMKLQGRHPKTPSQLELAAVAHRMVPRRVHPTWEPYLGISSSGSIDTRESHDPFDDATTTTTKKQPQEVMRGERSRNMEES